jgi:transposase
MGRVNTPNLDESAKAELEKRFRTDPRYAVRTRCQLVLLKAEGRTSTEVAGIVKLCEMTVNNWLNRYKVEGLSGLVTKPGRGRKPIISTRQDQQKALELVKQNRQRLQTAKTEWEAQQGKPVGRDAFRRFLKALTDDTNASVGE